MSDRLLPPMQELCWDDPWARVVAIPPEDVRTLQLSRLVSYTRVGGKVGICNGVAALPEAKFRAVIDAVWRFGAFDPDTNPFVDQDAVLIMGSTPVIVWGLACPNTSSAASPARVSPRFTRRLLMILLAATGP